MCLLLTIQRKLGVGALAFTLMFFRQQFRVF
jgi:hypothetical protein